MIAILAACALAQHSASDLTSIATRSAEKAIGKFVTEKTKSEHIAISITALDRSQRTFVAGSFRGRESMYPASVVKLFHVAYTAELLDQKRLTLTPELERAVRDMIVDSTNDATALVVDSISGTTGGPELPSEEFKAWLHNRQAINRWFESRGYPQMNVSNKTWNEGPYGRERQAYGPNFEHRNAISPDACARLLSEIMLDKISSAERCAWMRGYLARTAGDKNSYQASAFTGKVLAPGTKLHSKAGWTSTVRHDVAHVASPDGREFVLAIFTKDQSRNEALIPFLAKEILTELKVLP